MIIQEKQRALKIFLINFDNDFDISTSQPTAAVAERRKLIQIVSKKATFYTVKSSLISLTSHPITRKKHKITCPAGM